RGDLGPMQGGHGILAGPRALEDVAGRVDLAPDIAGLARDADLVFDLVVERLQFLQPEWPVFDRRALGDAALAVAARGLRHDLEVPGVQPPALGPVVHA